MLISFFGLGKRERTARSGGGHGGTEVHPVELGVLRQRRSGHRHRSRAAVAHPLHPFSRQQSG